MIESTNNVKSVEVAPRQGAGAVLQELIAAMPIVIFVTAVRTALQGFGGVRHPLRTSR